MAKFALERISRNGSKKKYFKLVREGKCFFDEFDSDIRKHSNLVNYLYKIYAYIEWDSEGEDTPDGAIKELKRNKGDNIKDFEFRTKKLRVYFFRDDNTGNIIVLGGINDKKVQEKDIAKMRRLKTEYFEWLKK